MEFTKEHIAFIKKYNKYIPGSATLKMYIPDKDMKRLQELQSEGLFSIARILRQYVSYKYYDVKQVREYTACEIQQLALDEI
jgi:hypothetical protein